MTQAIDVTSAPTRAAWMSVLAQAQAPVLRDLMAALGARPDFAWLRRPETGTVMVQGRAGGTGAAFNLGEMTVTRCALRLADGRVGHGYVAGRDLDQARDAALCDALLQGPEAAAVEAGVIAPLRAARDADAAARGARAAATRVDFFTLVRGED